MWLAVPLERRSDVFPAGAEPILVRAKFLSRFTRRCWSLGRLDQGRQERLAATSSSYARRRSVRKARRWDRRFDCYWRSVISLPRQSVPWRLCRIRCCLCRDAGEETELVELRRSGFRSCGRRHGVAGYFDSLASAGETVVILEPRETSEPTRFSSLVALACVQSQRRVPRISSTCGRSVPTR